MGIGPIKSSVLYYTNGVLTAGDGSCHDPNGGRVVTFCGPVYHGHDSSAYCEDSHATLDDADGDRL